jgi:hypothetical protein
MIRYLLAHIWIIKSVANIFTWLHAHVYKHRKVYPINNFLLITFTFLLRDSSKASFRPYCICNTLITINTVLYLFHVSAQMTDTHSYDKPTNPYFLVNDQRDAQIPFYVFIFIFNSPHVSSTSCTSSGETNCVNTTSGSCHSVLVAVFCAGLQTCTRHGHRQLPEVVLTQFVSSDDEHDVLDLES